jgi:hypothetical protein
VTLVSLQELPNPDVRHDYMVRLDGAVGDDARLTLHYVPDRSIADAGGFDAYLHALSEIRHDTPEALAARVLEDVNNALVPRWMRVTVIRPGHAVLIEDSQPEWENEALISVLARL